MSLILNIDTSMEIGFLCIAKDGVSICEAYNANQKDHAGFLQQAILDLTGKIGINLLELDAIAVTHGPGSYTGLRVGMASAKGLCYALKKPLIVINTLEAMADRVITQIGSAGTTTNALFCPMIDARRMEVFTALYDRDINAVAQPAALVLSTDSFLNYLTKQIVYFFGNGSGKWLNICKHENALFVEIMQDKFYMSKLSFNELHKKNFADIAYSEPFYLKEFHTIAKNL